MFWKAFWPVAVVVTALVLGLGYAHAADRPYVDQPGISEKLPPDIATNVFTYDRPFTQQQCLDHAVKTLQTLGADHVQQHVTAVGGRYALAEPVQGLYIRCEAKLKQVIFIVAGENRPDDGNNTFQVLDALVKSFNKLPVE
jgi:hypothetical protein